MTNSTQTSMTNSTQTAIPEIVKRTVEQAVKLLDASKTEYIIRLSDGTTITKGNMELAASTAHKRQPRRAAKMPHGSYTAAYKAPIVAMSVGDVLCLNLTPAMVKAGVTLSDISGTISSIATATFGNDSHKIHQNKVADRIELLRIA